MEGKRYTGKVKAPVIPVRFSQGGKVAWVKVKKGDKVKKGQALAGLDKRKFELQHKIELADYERARAEFDKLSREIPEAKTDDEKTEKQIAQAKLDKAVKAVEKTKFEMDQLTMISPVGGVVVEDSNLRAGMQISPASFEVEIMQVEKAEIEVEVDHKRIVENEWQPGEEVKVKINDKEVATLISWIEPLVEDEEVSLSLVVPQELDLWVGEKVEVSF